LFVGGNGERWLFDCWWYWWERIVCLLMVMVRDDCLFVDGNGEIDWLVMVRDACLFVDVNGERWLFVCWC
jgi:hypothetical protein